MEELAIQADADGIINTGFVTTETEEAQELVRGAPWWRRPRGPGRGPVTRASQWVGDTRENMTRLGTYIELLKRGDDRQTAARLTREYLFDYGEVGRFVEVARKFWMPFITFASKAIAFTLRETARRPGRTANIGKTMEALNELAGSEDRSLLPRGAASSFGVPFPDIARPLIGAPEGQTLMVNPERLFAFGTLNTLDPRISRVRQNILGGLMNPAARTGLEIATGKNFYLGSDMPRLARAPALINLAERAGLPIPSYVPAGAYRGKTDFYTGEPVGGYSSYLDAVLRLFPQYGQASQLIPGGGAPASAQLALSRYLFGVPVTPFDRAKALYRIQRFGNP